MLKGPIREDHVLFVYPRDCQEQIIFQAESVFLEGRGLDQVISVS